MDQLRIVSPADIQADSLPGGIHTRATGVFSLFLTLCCVLLLITGCGTPALTEGPTSLDDLGAQLVDALNRKDIHQLNTLMLTQREYSEILYPALPLSKPDWNTPADVAWRMHVANRDKQQDRIVAQWGAKQLQYVSLAYPGKPDTYPTLEVLRGAELIVRTREDREQTLTFVGSALKQGERLKLIGWKDR